MSKTFTFKGRKYRINISQTASAIIGLAGLGLWVYVILILEKAVLLG